MHIRSFANEMIDIGDVDLEIRGERTNRKSTISLQEKNNKLIIKTPSSVSKKTLVVNLEDYVSKLEKDDDGNYLIPIWSDLKRHDMGPKLDNERPLQKGVPTNYWLTKKLWGFYSEPPFLHHGRANLLNDVIEMHQGDAKISSDAYFELDSSEQQYLIEFLKSFK